MKRGAFLEQYKQQPLFKENLDEFDSAKEVKFKNYFLKNFKIKI
jgi:hypothetical protein